MPFAAVFGQDTIRLEEVEVRRFRWQDSVQVESVPAAWIYREGPVGLVASLQQYSSAWVRQMGEGGPALVSLDGMNPQHTQVFWNGLPVNNTLTGTGDLSIYPATGDMALRLHDAGGGMPYTAAGAGGLLWLESVYANQRSLDVQVLSGSYGRWEALAGARWAADSGSVRLRLDAGYAGAKHDYPYQDYNTSPIQEATLHGAEFRRFFMESGVQVKMGQRHGFRADMHGSHTRRQVPPSVIAPNNRSRYEEAAGRAALHWTFQGTAWQGELQAGYTYDYLSYREESAGRSVGESAYRSHQARIGYRAGYRLGRHLLEAGGQFSWFRVAGRELSRQDLVTGGIFARWEARFLAGRLRTGITVRPEGHSVSGITAGSEAEVAWQPSAKWPVTLYASASSNTRFPTLADLFFEPSGNPDLDRESAWKIKGGVRTDLHREAMSLRFDASGYHTWLRDMILWVPSSKQYWQPLNLAGVRSRGLGVTLDWGLGSPAGKWQAGLYQAYRLSVSTNERNPEASSLLFPNDLTLGKQLPYIPVHQYKAGVRAGYAGFYLLGNAVFTSARFINGSNTYYLPAYWMVHLGAGYEREMGRMYVAGQFRVRNLTGNDWYQEVAHVPMPPRHYEFLIRFRYAR